MRKNRREEWLTEGKLSCDGWKFIEEKGPGDNGRMSRR